MTVRVLFWLSVGTMVGWTLFSAYAAITMG
jgi:hypothetical protein